MTAKKHWLTAAGVRAALAAARVLGLSVCVFASGGRPGAAQPYEKLTADAPGYENTDVWPHAKGAPYAAQKWEKAPRLVWAEPGRDGNWQDAKSWLDTATGKPAGRAPDRHTDAVLPASAKPYTVKTSSKCNVRHVTIERGALAVGFHNSYNNLNIWGNCWVKRGGRIHFIDVVGPEHTFLRVDNPFPGEGSSGKYHFTPNGYHNAPDYCASHIHHKMSICKYGDASVEIVGTVGIGDEMYVTKGRMIIGPGAQFRYKGSRAKGTFEIFDGGTLEVQSGGLLSPFDNSPTEALNLSVYRGGTLQGGSPRRPLTSDAFIFLGMGGGEGVGLYAATGSTIRVYTADPKKARLVFSSPNARAGFCDGQGRKVGNPDKSAGNGYGTILRLAGDVQFDGVMLDYVRPGGLRPADPAMMKGWQNVFYGPHNAGAVGELLGPMRMKTDIYYHKRKYDRYRQRVGKDLSEMKKFEGGQL